MSSPRLRLPALLALLVTLGFACGCRRQATAPPILGQVPEFALVAEDGAGFGSAELAGRAWVANFIFTRCPDVCPVFTAKMAQVQQRTDDLGAKLMLVSFSVDPTHDTPERLAVYAEGHGARRERWRFLTGDPQAVKAAVEAGLKSHIDQQGERGGVPNISHGSHFVLVDANGRIRGFYDMNDEDAIERLVRDARIVAGGR